MSEMTSWREELSGATKILGQEIEASTLTDDDLNREFNPGYGGSQGVPFTAWTVDWVLFPVVYDGAEWVGYVPRNPCDEATPHVGSE